MTDTPERKARRIIDANLEAAGWLVQSHDDLDLTAGSGVAVREFPMKPGFGTADYVLYVDRMAIGAIEAKPEGTLTGVEEQSEKYAVGLPDDLPAHHRPLPFVFESNGSRTAFTNGLDPTPRSRHVFNFPRPETLAEWSALPTQMRARLRTLPPLDESRLWSVQARALRNLEESLGRSDQRALIQMATGSGKTFTAVNAVYRLLKHGGARRVLFLVDRNNLGRQTHDEFANFAPPDDARKFPELYTVQRLAANAINPAAKVVITTIQRLYSMLKGDAEYDSGNEEDSAFDSPPSWHDEPPDVEYNPSIPPEYFDFIIVDECHRSIYNVWSQVLLYFDAFLVGLTATPDNRTIAFFSQNLIMQYGHDEAVIDGVNVDFDVYRIRTKVTEQGATIEADGTGVYVEKRNKLTRKERLERLEDDLTYTANQLDRDVVSESQIRTVLQQFRDKVLPEAFPGRGEVPKTLIFAKDDSHADDIVRIAREVFAERNDFCRKITYRTGFTKEIKDCSGRRRQRDGGDRLGEDIEPHSGRDPEKLPPELRSSHRRHGRHDLHRHRREADRVRLLHAKRRIRRFLRADERPRGAGDIARQAACGDSERQGEGSIHRRRRGRRLRTGQDRLAPAQPTAIEDTRANPQSRRPGRHQPGRPDDARCTARTASAPVQSRPSRGVEGARWRQVLSRPRPRPSPRVRP